MHFTTLTLSMLATNAMALHQRWVPHQVVHTHIEVVTVTAPVTIVTEVVHVDANAAPVEVQAYEQPVEVQAQEQPVEVVKEVYVQPTTLVKVKAPKPTVAAVSTSNSALTSDQQGALDAHNAARSEVGNSPLVWDDALVADAQSWADHLVSLGSLVHASLDGQGENLYMQSNLDNPCTNAVNAFVSEKSVYHGEKIGEGDFMAYGHYTQVTWKSTTKVGMAVASGNGKTFVVARYTSPGNFMGETPF